MVGIFRVFKLGLNLLFLFLVGATTLSAQVFDMVVDANGGGDYQTLQAAFDAVPANSTTRTLIFVKAGTYTEKVWLKSTKINVSVIGENAETVIIDWNDYQGKDGLSGADSYTFLAEGADLYMENITIRNSAGAVGQAVGLRTIGDRQIFKNCKYIGNQDTYYAHKNRQYHYKCFVEGNTDFIYGDATTVFDSCTINSIRGGNYITAPADSKLITQLTTGDFIHGLLFRNCNVTAASNVLDNTVSLGRPWQPKASSVFIKCTLGSHIKPLGWSTWEGTNHLSSVFAEYQNVDENGNLVDVSQRATWSSQLTEAQANNFYSLKFFLRKSFVEWNPMPVVTSLQAPSAVSVNVKTVSWFAVADAVGYVIYRNNQYLGSTKSTSFVDPSLTEDIATYTVVSVSSDGTLSNGTVGNNNPLSTPKVIQKATWFIDNNGISTLSPSSIQLFDITGVCVLSASNVNWLAINQLNDGVYILRLTDRQGDRIVKKIVYRQ